MSNFEFTSRYEATGTPFPDPATMCNECEGMGCYPVKFDTDDPADRKLWEEKEVESPSEDGWHFVQCPHCKGTRLRPTP